MNASIHEESMSSLAFPTAGHDGHVPRCLSSIVTAGAPVGNVLGSWGNCPRWLIQDITDYSVLRTYILRPAAKQQLPPTTPYSVQHGM